MTIFSSFMSKILTSLTDTWQVTMSQNNVTYSTDFFVSILEIFIVNNNNNNNKVK